MRLLDTDVCIEILRGNRRVLQRRRETLDHVAITWMSACELAYGAAKSARPEANRIVVNDFLTTLPIINFSLPVAWHFGQQKARLRLSGQTVADADLLIAATALAEGAILVTGNRKHYERVDGLILEDWIRGDAAD